jgi:hypothetical protein
MRSYAQRLMDRAFDCLPMDYPVLKWYERLWVWLYCQKVYFWAFRHRKAWKDANGIYHSYPANNWRRIFWK